MASIHKASNILPQICLLFITAIQIAAGNRRSVLTDLYKQAAEQNRPLIVVVDNHSKDKGKRNEDLGVYKESKHASDESVPLHYIYPKASPSPSKSKYAQEMNSESKIDLLKYYLSRLLSRNQSGIKKNSGRSDDRDRDQNRDNRNYNRDKHDHRDRYYQYEEQDADAKYNVKPLAYYKPRESREYKSKSKNNIYRPEDRDLYDRERYDRDRYRLNRDREDKYRSEKDRYDRDRVDRYRQEKNRDRDNYGDRYRDDGDRYQSQYKYQAPQSKGRYTDNYGANVMKNLLRYSNDLTCEAKTRCLGKCYKRARMLRKKGVNCEYFCANKFSCEESEEEEEKGETNDNHGCDGRGSSSESCADENNDNMSTKGYTDNSEEKERDSEHGFRSE